MFNRLTLELSKIEEGLFNGEVLYHRKVVKTEEELSLIKLEREKKKKEKARRRKIQEENSQNKDLVKDEHKRKSMAGMKVRFDRNEVETPEDDDAAYYKEEIGEEPDEGKKRQYHLLWNVELTHPFRTVHRWTFFWPEAWFYS